MSDIYQRLWDGDRNQLSVSSRKESGEWENENADILLDEQVQASGDRTLADRPLFYRVNEEKFGGPTYKSFMRLLDNYVISTRGTEEMTEAEAREINEFMDAIVATEPMAIAFDYIGKDLRINLSEL